MIVELGHFALILAFMVAGLQTVLPLWGAARRDAVLMSIAGPAAVAQFLLIAVAFGAAGAVPSNSSAMMWVATSSMFLIWCAYCLPFKAE